MLKCFQQICFLDTTLFLVSKYLVHLYPESGGCAQTAGD
ncbi:Transposase for insertion sequence element IS231B [Bacillus thuringiensis serovar tochigiensis BGSC 4Y1]|nr:Transposase for insertion sequence element IS231B [Bacillus thuringiensis serovar tochigiensis BGSC 4Y1]